MFDRHDSVMHQTQFALFLDEAARYAKAEAPHWTSQNDMKIEPC